MPIYNQQDNLIPLTHKIREAIYQRIHSYEIIYIDDGSTDGSSVLLDQLAQEYKEVKVYHLKNSPGQTAAFATGFRKAAGRLVATIDADLQDDPSDILNLIPLTNKYDLVCGVRVNCRKGFGFIKMIMSLILDKVRYRFSNEAVDTGFTLKLFKSEVVKSLYLELIEILYLFKGMDRYFPSLAKMNGYRVTHAPINFCPQSKISEFFIGNRMQKRLKTLYPLAGCNVHNSHFVKLPKDNII